VPPCPDCGALEGDYHRRRCPQPFYKNDGNCCGLSPEVIAHQREFNINWWKGKKMTEAIELLMAEATHLRDKAESQTVLAVRAEKAALDHRANAQEYLAEAQALADAVAALQATQISVSQAA
jgi:hypothetical protein